MYPSGSGGLIVVRKLVALDITLHGPRFILAEFGIGTPAIFAFGLWLAFGEIESLLGVYLVLTGINYVPLLVYTIIIVRSGTARKEVEYGLAHERHYIRRYSTQQLLIFVPLAVLLLAIAQELRETKPLK